MSELRCVVISKEGMPYGPFDTLAEVREFVARKFPGEEQDEGGYGTPAKGWRLWALWPPES